ncbi:ferritin [Anaeroselena agilis]|uniref:Ferritin n=1 Tax=Anaeroselena agilis TaxID=3063788 RepID=A0ABU3NT39_9FIRM|nr:ferritin [Selenomonadales bacterium 4137-cl]
MQSKKMQDAFNDQIQAEMASAYLYLAMAAYCEGKNLKGFGHWLRAQYNEEVGHAMKMFDFVIERGGQVVLKSIEAPAADFGSPLAVFEKVLAHEQQITARINSLYELALAEKDYASQIFLQWFITEQVEEEGSAGEIIEKMKMAGDKGNALVWIDKELGKR